jgi:hypothetical protein
MDKLSEYRFLVLDPDNAFAFALLSFEFVLLVSDSDEFEKIAENSICTPFENMDSLLV